MPKKIISPMIVVALAVLFILAGLPKVFAEERVVTTVEEIPSNPGYPPGKIFKDQNGKIIKKETYNRAGEISSRERFDENDNRITRDIFLETDPPGRRFKFSRQEYGPDGKMTAKIYYRENGETESKHVYNKHGHAVKKDEYDAKGKVTKTTFYYYDIFGKLIKTVVLTDMQKKLIKAGLIEVDEYGRPDPDTRPKLDKVIKKASNISGIGDVEIGIGMSSEGYVRITILGADGSVKVVKKPEEPGAYEGPPPRPFFGLGPWDAFESIFFGGRPVPGQDADVGTENVEDILRQAEGGVQTPQQSSTPATTTPSISTLDTTTTQPSTTPSTTSSTSCPAGYFFDGVGCAPL